MQLIPGMLIALTYIKQKNHYWRSKWKKFLQCLKTCGLPWHLQKQEHLNFCRSQRTGRSIGNPFVSIVHKVLKFWWGDHHVRTGTQFQHTEHSSPPALDAGRCQGFGVPTLQEAVEDLEIAQLPAFFQETAGQGKKGEVLGGRLDQVRALTGFPFNPGAIPCRGRRSKEPWGRNWPRRMLPSVRTSDTGHFLLWLPVQAMTR